MEALILFLSVTGYLYFFYIYAKCKFIQTPFYFSTFVIFVLYLFAISGHLELGAYFCLALGLCMGLIAAYLNRDRYLNITYQSLLTKNNLYEIACLIPLVIIIASIPSSYQFMDWDEFSFWGLSIKIIATADSLYNANYPTEYNHYPPGQQLFQYFIIKFIGWSERNALYAHIILSFSALLYIAGSFYKNANFKTLVSFFTVCLLIYYVGFMYASVYSDKLLAFYFCAVLVCAYFSKNEVSNLVLLCVALMVLVLIKQVGLLMALLVIAVYGITHYPSHTHLKTYSKRHLLADYFYTYRFLVISIICLLASIYFSYQTWKWYVDSIGANKYYYIPSLLEFLEGERLQMLGATLSEFIKRIQTTDFITIRGVGLSLLNTTFAFLLISLAGIVICDTSKRVQFSVVLGIIFMGWIGYILFHLYAYQVFFGKAEALSLASFERYAGIYFLSAIMFIYFAISADLLRLNTKIASSILVMFFCITLIGQYPKLRGDLSENFTTYNYDILQRINGDTALVNSNVKYDDSVYFIAQGATAYDRWAFYYAVYPKMKKLNPWSLCPVTDWYACSEQKLSEVLVGFQYLMLSNADDYFWEQAGDLFDSAEYGKKSGLYAVIYKDGVVVKLSRVNVLPSN